MKIFRIRGVHSSKHCRLPNADANLFKPKVVSYFQFFLCGSLRFSADLRDLCVETAINAENAEVRREPQRTLLESRHHQTKLAIGNWQSAMLNSPHFHE